MAASGPSPRPNPDEDPARAEPGHLRVHAALARHLDLVEDAFPAAAAVNRDPLAEPGDGLDVAQHGVERDPLDPEPSNRPRQGLQCLGVVSRIERLREAYKEVIQAYRLASARLREGDLTAEFPEGMFPPALPFVPFAENSTVGSRGQPF